MICYSWWDFEFPVPNSCTHYQVPIPWHCSVVVITTAQLNSTKPELRSCTGSKPARSVSEIRDGEDLWQWSQLDIRLNTFHQSTIPQKQSIALSYFTLKDIVFVHTLCEYVSAKAVLLHRVWFNESRFVFHDSSWSLVEYFVNHIKWTEHKITVFMTCK